MGRFTTFTITINAKLSPFGKIVNITWFVFFIISFATSLIFRVSISVPMYFIVTLPILILAFCCIIILFRKEFGLQRYICLSLTALNMLLSQEWVDLPSYVKQDYKVVEGVPSVFAFHQSRSGPRYWEVVVDDVEFSMPENINERFSNRWFVIYYLPHYKFILDYKILTEEETRKKLQMLKYDLCYCTDEGRLVNKKVGLTMDKSKWKYPALIRQEKDGDFGVYFPTLFSGVGWDYPLSRGNTKEKAIEKAKKDLAYTIAGIIYDNDVVPEPVMIPTEQLSEDMEIIEIETCYEDYKKEIEEHLLGRHWHIDYWDEEFGVISTFGFRNEQGTWNIYFSEHTSDDEAKFLDKHYKRTSNSSNEWLLFTVKSRSEAEEKVYNFIENVLLPIRRVNK